MTRAPAHPASWLARDAVVGGARARVARRPDGTLKVTRASSRSPPTCGPTACCGAPRCAARTRARGSCGIDLTGALALPGVYAVLTAEDVPGREAATGWSIADQPVLAIDEVRYQGEPVAIVAADHPETARRAADRDRGRLRGAARRSSTRAPRAPGAADGARPAATCCGTCRSAAATRRAAAAVVVTGEYEVGMQDQAFLGPESGLAVPAEDGGVDLYVATQWLHVDRGRSPPASGCRRRRSG